MPPPRRLHPVQCLFLVVLLSFSLVTGAGVGVDPSTLTTATTGTLLSQVGSYDTPTQLCIMQDLPLSQGIIYGFEANFLIPTTSAQYFWVQTMRPSTDTKLLASNPNMVFDIVELWNPTFPSSTITTSFVYVLSLSSIMNVRDGDRLAWCSLTSGLFSYTEDTNQTTWTWKDGNGLRGWVPTGTYKRQYDFKIYQWVGVQSTSDLNLLQTRDYLALKSASVGSTRGGSFTATSNDEDTVDPEDTSRASSGPIPGLSSTAGVVLIICIAMIGTCIIAFLCVAFSRLYAKSGDPSAGNGVLSVEGVSAGADADADAPSRRRRPEPPVALSPEDRQRVADACARHQQREAALRQMARRERNREREGQVQGDGGDVPAGANVVINLGSPTPPPSNPHADAGIDVGIEMVGIGPPPEYAPPTYEDAIEPAAIPSAGVGVICHIDATRRDCVTAGDLPPPPFEKHLDTYIYGKQHHNGKQHHDHNDTSMSMSLSRSWQPHTPSRSREASISIDQEPPELSEFRDQPQHYSSIPNSVNIDYESEPEEL